MLDFRKYTPQYEMYLTNDVIDFWKAHGVRCAYAQAVELIQAWTNEGHLLYLVISDNQLAGFFHLGNRGHEVNWLEHLYIKPPFRGKGLAHEAVAYAEKLVQQQGYASLYLEVLPLNLSALKTYRDQGFTTLNTITLRKDYEEFPVIGKETIQGMDFTVKGPKNK